MTDMDDPDWGLGSLERGASVGYQITLGFNKGFVPCYCTDPKSKRPLTNAAVLDADVICVFIIPCYERHFSRSEGIQNWGLSLERGANVGYQIILGFNKGFVPC